MADREYMVPVPVADRVAEAVLIALDERAPDEQVLRDRLETAIRTSMAELWPTLRRQSLDRMAAVIAVAAVNELRQG